MAAASSSFTPPSTSLTSSFSHLVTIKLNPENFVLWKVQITAYLKGQELFSFVDGSQTAPPKYLPTETDADLKINPDFSLWQITYQLLLSIIFSSLTESVIGHVVSAGTSRELWLRLKSMFTSHSQAKEFQVRFQLTNLSRGDQSISEFFSKVRLFSDTLTVPGNPLTNKEFVTYILNGLGPGYESIISITT